VILGSPKEKAHGHDRYIGLFFSTCWEIVKGDIISAIQRFYNMNQQGLSFLNQAFVVLIPKKNNPTRITDYRPISLTHSFAKVISKLLANRLGPELDHLISINQTAFIKDRCIHDNFIYGQEALKVLHKKKIPGLFIKLDISKAFDSVNWAYLLQIMKFIGFSQRWMNWISALWGTTSSVFLLNGEPDKRILHYRGVG
jgi:retron-type reverse transcriptase